MLEPSNVAVYILSSQDYYEPLNQCSSGEEYRRVARDHVPDNWSVHRENLWFAVRPSNVSPPSQGFKIHVSATPLNALHILDLALPICIKHQTTLKFVASHRILQVINSKNYSRGGSNKFITIYPSAEDFASLCKEIHEATEHESSPHILSDCLYEEDSAVFYRYGGFSPRTRLRVDGTSEPVIEDPGGELIIDERTPYYSLPDWVKDPFDNVSRGKDTESILLKGRYKVLSALKFSNAGGVYVALDKQTDDEVVIKEARPLTNIWTRGGESIDAVNMIENEYRILRRLMQLEATPNPIDLFTEWKHRFLVIEKKPGTPLTRYRAQDRNSLVPFYAPYANTTQFLNTFSLLAHTLIRIVREGHELGILFSDLSPSNILVDDDPYCLSVIDFESSIDINDDSQVIKQYSSAWSTPGFATKDRSESQSVTARDDFYALGMTLFSTILPSVPLFQHESSAYDRILSGIESATGLPKEVRGTIDALCDGNPDDALCQLESLDSTRPPSVFAPQPLPRDKEEMDARLNQEVSEIATFVRSTLTPERSDRITPSNPQAFQTNPVSVGYGSAGVALFLHAATRGEQGTCLDEAHDSSVEKARSSVDSVLDWTIATATSTSELPPGLYTGSSGIAVVLLELGRRSDAFALLARATSSALRFDDPGLFHGAAGYGLACLRFHHVTGEPSALASAVEAADHLLAVSEECTEGRYWSANGPESAHLGLGHGASGIGLFLLHLGKATGSVRYTDAARAAVRFDLSSAKVDGDRLQIGDTPGSTTMRPYWLQGAAGLGSVLVRFGEVLGEEQYIDAARRTARGAFCRFSVGPWQFEGLSGIGELMIDLYRATGDVEHLERAYEIGDSVLRYGVGRPTGRAYPGQYLVRLSNDFGTGAAGVGLFLHRLVHRGRRPLHDVSLPLPQATVTR